MNVFNCATPLERDRPHRSVMFTVIRAAAQEAGNKKGVKEISSTP
jgi:hypothetical protein